MVALNQHWRMRKACTSNPGLPANYRQNAEKCLSCPALYNVAHTFMTLTSGAKLGPYEIFHPWAGAVWLKFIARVIRDWIAQWQ